MTDQHDEDYAIVSWYGWDDETKKWVSLETKVKVVKIPPGDGKWTHYGSTSEKIK